MIRYAVAAFTAFMLALALPLSAADAPDNWDGLVKVASKKLALVYLQPQADFRGYSKVIIDPPQVAFRKNWQKEQNEDRLGARRVTDKDARKILDAAQEGLTRVFTDEYTKAGFQLVQAPEEDVLRISTAIINIDVNAPDIMSAGRTRVYSEETGEATLVIEARDSVTGALLGRAVDRRIMDDSQLRIRNSVTNAAEFESVFRRWGKASANGLNELKNLSPVNPAGLQTKR